ncbi:PHP domain-containing protein [Natronomonas marina]|jgi:predicted metal-dependent phosphoesterase TrpH|uniref:PHP domain-containing protein n=1 Tax=Natronomonas marina TaxID=2961939 RepID=UPI0020C95469|nr:PHP domain-containing protein [Natronomonas marina]
MVVADLHVHTTNSDGTLTLSTLAEAAEAAGVSAVAVTDHDRLHPDIRAPVAAVGELTVVHGIELRVEAGDERVDLLGYGARRTDDLESLVEHLQADRIERGRRIIERVEERVGVELPVEPREGLGRPHIARAIESATEYSYEGAFEELIGADCPCFVARDVPSFEEGAAVLREACGLVSLAHPFRYDDPEAALELCADLDAVERFYPYGREVDTRPLERAVERYDLLVTGGSDAHGETLGEAGLDRTEYRRFRAAL